MSTHDLERGAVSRLCFNSLSKTFLFSSRHLDLLFFVSSFHFDHAHVYTGATACTVSSKSFTYSRNKRAVCTHTHTHIRATHVFYAICPVCVESLRAPYQSHSVCCTPKINTCAVPDTNGQTTFVYRIHGRLSIASACTRREERSDMPAL